MWGMDSKKSPRAGNPCIGTEVPFAKVADDLIPGSTSILSQSILSPYKYFGIIRYRTPTVLLHDTSH
jgi:hypothetical protein